MCSWEPCCTFPSHSPRKPLKKGHLGWSAGCGWLATLARCQGGLDRRGSICAQDISSQITTLIPKHPWPHPLLMDAKARVNTTKETQCLLARTLHDNTLDPSTGCFMSHSH